MHLVTGGAGFIGSHIVRALNERGHEDVVVVDDLTRSAKFENLSGTTIADYLDKRELLPALEQDRLPRLTAIYHQGACTDTREQDGRYLMENNFEYSKRLMHHALEHEVPFVYASSAAIYGRCGRTRAFQPDPGNERPINAYGFSKLVFDQYARRFFDQARSSVVGLRYFNVYGPHECFKGRMASMVYQLWRQLEETGTCRLFRGTDGFEDGEQRRDFVFVEDAVKVNLHFAAGPARQAIVNVGTGASASFNQVAQALIARLGRGEIEYVPFDEGLRGRYQSFTEAELESLRGAGYEAEFTSLAAGVEACVDHWRAAARARGELEPALPTPEEATP